MRIYWETLEHQIFELNTENMAIEELFSAQCWTAAVSPQVWLQRQRCRAWLLGGGHSTAERRMLWEAVWDRERVTSSVLGHLRWNQFNWKIFLVLMRAEHSRAARAAEAAGRQRIRPELPPASPGRAGREMGAELTAHRAAINKIGPLWVWIRLSPVLRAFNTQFFVVKMK